MDQVTETFVFALLYPLLCLLFIIAGVISKES
jgi:hypothetical protein